jgi:hypothetical protein
MTYLLFLTALSLSGVAAYYSIMGLVAIFAAAPVPILIMGSLLEAAKLVVASWLYRSWKEVPLLMKSYFTMALVVLMILTSMGIFGYLSKAHLDQAIPSGDVAAKLSLIDEKIRIEKENLNASRKELNQLDVQVDQTIARTTEASGAERAIAIRRAQQRDRSRILNEIGASQAKIAKLNEERSPIASEVRKVEAEVGPIKYIAALLYGDNPEVDVLEKAVRWVIIMIVIVFDPLAVLMLIAANWQLRQGNPLPKQEISETVEERKDPLTWAKVTDKINIKDIFSKKVQPLPTDAKEIITEFFQKEEPPVQEEPKKTKIVRHNTEYDANGNVMGTTHKHKPDDTIEKSVEDLQKKSPWKS